MAGETFRRPYDYRPALAAAAVLFGGPVVQNPPLGPPINPQEALACAYRPDFAYRQVPAFPWQIFQTPDSPPLRQSLNPYAVVGWRDQSYHLPTQQTRAAAWLSILPPDSPPLVQPMPPDGVLGWREYRYPNPTPRSTAAAWLAALPPDVAPLQQPLPPYGVTAWRDYAYPNPTQQSTGSAWVSLAMPDAPPLSQPPGIQALVAAAWRDPAYPIPTQLDRRGLLAATFFTNTFPLPRTILPSAIPAWRDANYPNAANILQVVSQASAAVGLSSLPPDAPPLALQSGLLGATAWRDRHYPIPTQGNKTAVLLTGSSSLQFPIKQTIIPLSNVAWRDPAYPLHPWPQPGRLDASLLDLLGADQNAVGQIDVQQAAQTAWRSDFSFRTPSVFPTHLFKGPDAPPLSQPPGPQALLVAAWREPAQPYRQPWPNPITLIVPVDAPPLTPPSTAHVSAWRDPFYPLPTQQTKSAAWLTAIAPDSPPIQGPNPQILGLTGYRLILHAPQGRPGFATWLSALIDLPPLVQPMPPAGIMAWRDYTYPLPTQQTRATAWVVLIFDPPPLQQPLPPFAALAWRDYNYPLPTQQTKAAAWLNALPPDAPALIQFLPPLGLVGWRDALYPIPTQQSRAAAWLAPLLDLPLRAHVATAAAQAAYRDPNYPLPTQQTRAAAFLAALPPDLPPLVVNYLQQIVAAGLRTPPLVPVPMRPIIDLLELFSETAAVGQGEAQQIAAAGWREPWSRRNIFNVSPALFQVVVPDAPPPLGPDAQGLAARAYRTVGNTLAQDVVRQRWLAALRLAAQHLPKSELRAKDFLLRELKIDDSFLAELFGREDFFL